MPFSAALCVFVERVLPRTISRPLGDAEIGAAIADWITTGVRA